MRTLCTLYTLWLQCAMYCSHLCTMYCNHFYAQFRRHNRQSDSQTMHQADCSIRGISFRCLFFIYKTKVIRENTWCSRWNPELNVKNLTFEKRCNLLDQAKQYPVDLYYLMDLSNSMSDDRDNVVKLGGQLAETIENITRNYQIGSVKDLSWWQPTKELNHEASEDITDWK